MQPLTSDEALKAKWLSDLIKPIEWEQVSNGLRCSIGNTTYYIKKSLSASETYSLWLGVTCIESNVTLEQAKQVAYQKYQEYLRNFLNLEK